MMVFIRAVVYRDTSLAFWAWFKNTLNITLTCDLKHGFKRLTWGAVSNMAKNKPKRLFGLKKV